MHIKKDPKTTTSESLNDLIKQEQRLKLQYQYSQEKAEGLQSPPPDPSIYVSEDQQENAL